jgi:hypothetical protein
LKRSRGERFNFFSAVTTLGTAQDITIQELRIESFFPADEPTRGAATRIATGEGSGQGLGQKPAA